MWRGSETKKVPVTVVRKLTMDLIESGAFSIMFTEPDYDWNKNAIDAMEKTIFEGTSLGKRLGKKLQIRSEKKELKFNRLKTGKIDKRLIASLGYGYESVFHKIESSEYDPGIIHISIDNSGSMSGGNIHQAMKTATAIAKACSMIDNMDCVISFRAGTWENVSKCIMLIAYDSRVDKFHKIPRLLKYIDAGGNTPEGLCFDAISKEIISAGKGKDAYFLNLSDGQPYFQSRGLNYEGHSARRHTKNQMKKFRENGIKVLSYFIGGYNMSKFREMYGKDAQSIDTNRLTELAKSMNAKFLEKA
jgi:hypothetical protein